MIPDGCQGPCGDVIVMSGEDDPEDTLQPRLALNGADFDRVHFLDGILDLKGEPRGLEIPLDLRLIEQEVVPRPAPGRALRSGSPAAFSPDSRGKWGMSRKP